MAKKLEYTDETVLSLIQESYQENSDQRNKALGLLNKYLKNVETNTDIVLLSKSANDILKVIDSSIGRKIEMAKIINEIINKKGGNIKEEDANKQLSKEAKLEMRSIIKQIKSGNINVLGE